MVCIDAVAIDSRPLKRARHHKQRRVTADLHDFLTFPAGGAGFEGPFRWNVRSFISRYARIESPPQPHGLSQLRTWRIAFKIGKKGRDGEEEAEAIVELDVVEEDVGRSRKTYCDHCRISGWSGNPVCTMRYHFIIRNENSPVYQQTCTHCGTMQHLSELRCGNCNYELIGVEDWAYLHLEDPTHLLHGVVHANGYGHLLRINGREGGSRILTGRDVMEFWDRLCEMLNVRKMTVMDVSKKNGVEYRLLHAVTTGLSWYGKWGYQFGAGSFSTTAEGYQAAVHTLASMTLSLFDSHTPQSPLKSTIAFYTSLCRNKLKTVRDLLCFMSHLLQDSHENKHLEVFKKGEVNAPVPSTWTEEDIQQAESRVVKILHAVKSKWVASRALRGATFQSIASLELLDFCLKRLSCRPTDDGLVVAARWNADTSSAEYRLETPSNKLVSAQIFCRPTRDHLLCDLKLLYNALLNPATMQSYIPQSALQSAQSSATKLLDCKHFIKHYDNAKDLMTSNTFALRIWCHLELADRPKDYVTPPPELLVLPTTATVADLKLEATKAFQETYLIFQRFRVEQLLLNCEGVNDATKLNFLLRSKDSVQVRGRCLGGEYIFQHFRWEKGTENWTVDCSCGARDDDGERMLACDNCGVWQHTRCSGINDSDEVPAEFICSSCNIRIPKCRGKGGRICKYASTTETC